MTIEISEQTLPVKPTVRAACEMLGFDPLYVANERKLVAFVKESDADKVLGVMQKTKYGEDAGMIRKVIRTGKSQVRLKTAIGAPAWWICCPAKCCRGFVRFDSRQVKKVHK